MKKALLLFFVVFFQIIAFAKNPYAAVVVDAKSGQIIEGFNEDVRIYPASLTKMMTLLLLFDVLQKKKIRLDTLFRVSNHASQQPACKLGLRPGQKISVKDCILALAVRSCNDVAMVVAENLGWNEKRFVRAMNKKAQLLGMKKTHFENPSGWHHPYQKTTASDLAILTKALWDRYKEYAHFLAKPSFSFGNKTYKSTNKLVGVVPGLKISKTGYTDASGYNLATLTSKNNQDKIIIVIGKKTGKERDANVKQLIQAAFESPYLLSSLMVLKGCMPAKSNNYKKIAFKKSKKRKPKVKKPIKIRRKNISIPWHQMA